MLRARTRRSLALASLGLVLVSACDEAKAPAVAKQAPPAAEPAAAQEPEGLGLEDGQRWRLELDGEGPVAGRYGGEAVAAKRKQDDLTITLEAEGVSLVLTLEQVPMGQTGRFPATPTRFHASATGVDCNTAMGGAIRVNLTHNAIDRVAGRIEGELGCKPPPEGGRASWDGAFDYSGAIEFR